MGLEVLTAYIKEVGKNSPREFRVSEDAIQRIRRYSQDTRGYSITLDSILSSTTDAQGHFRRKIAEDAIRVYDTTSRFGKLSDQLEQGNSVDLVPSNYRGKGKKIHLMLQPSNMQFGDMVEVVDDLLRVIYPKEENYDYGKTGHMHLESSRIKAALKKGKTIRLVPPQK